MSARSKKTVSILIVDDHPIVRLGLQAVFASQGDLTICCETETMDAALAALRTSSVDLAIVEPVMKAEDGLALIRRLRKIKPGLPVLVYTLYDAALFAELAFTAGADGYVMKRETTDRLLFAIREVLAGRKYASQRPPPK
jgi:DNA-binding NarL/FixJ family response regulator